jgi:hypothetical protein
MKKGKNGLPDRMLSRSTALSTLVILGLVGCSASKRWAHHARPAGQLVEAALRCAQRCGRAPSPLRLAPLSSFCYRAVASNLPVIWCDMWMVIVFLSFCAPFRGTRSNHFSQHTRRNQFSQHAVRALALRSFLDMVATTSSRSILVPASYEAAQVNKRARRHNSSVPRDVWEGQTRKLS